MRITRLGMMLGILVAASGAFAAEGVLEITKDTVLEKGKEYGAIVIKASNVKVEGNGAWVIGARAGNANKFTGVGVWGKGVSNVVLKGVNAKGWETGLKVEEAEGWVIEGCDFSDNFHDPEFGWGEQGRRGGIVLEKVKKSVVSKCKANRVWDGCVLVDSDENRIEECDFSRASNTCLKMWTACRNVVSKCNLSYGIRIKPGEVHARDSTSVLMESGSNDNRLIGNDCSHGGDGIFVRVLNGWVSTGNVFEGNDCSYANNNCVEAWSPRNTYIRNKANHGSYGFWLGASDQTVLIENEASYNGLPTGMHNSPHLPEAGHAGIVFMFGPSSHTVVRGNVCVGNNGAGVAVIGDMDSQGKKWRAYHWIIEQNRLEGNRWGIYMQYADWINVGANVFRGNSEKDVMDAGGVTNLLMGKDEAGVREPPRVVVSGPAMGKVGQEVVLDASKSRDPSGRALTFRWDWGDGTIAGGARAAHVFKEPGFYRVGVTGTNGVLSDLGWRDFYVVEDLKELGTEGASAEWGWVDPQSKVVFKDDDEVKISGGSSVYALVKPYGGGRVSLLYPRGKSAGWSLAGKTKLVFWVKAINENVPAWQDLNPLVTLYEAEGRSVKLSPARDLMSQPPYNEAREGWTYFVVPLGGDGQWKREGGQIGAVNWITIGFDSWGAPPLRIWLDGLALK